MYSSLIFMPPPFLYIKNKGSVTGR